MRISGKFEQFLKKGAIFSGLSLVVVGLYIFTLNNTQAANVSITYTSDHSVVLSIPYPQIAIDTTATTKQETPSIDTKTPFFSTTGSNELLVAFVSTDGPQNDSQSFTSVNGGGLTWTLRTRANSQAGTAEIWTAVAPTALTNIQVNAIKAESGFMGFISVVAFIDADTVNVGASNNKSAPTGAASVNLTATSDASWVWAVGTDWDSATARTVLAGQDKVDEHFAPVGDTFWLQRLTNRSNLGDVVTIGTSAPTIDRWNIAALEIRPKL